MNQIQNIPINKNSKTRPKDQAKRPPFVVRRWFNYYV